MRRIGVLSDTHGVVPNQVYTFFKDCDELWHAGDMGRGVYEELSRFKPLRAVYGNMDDYDLRYQVPGTNLFTCEGLKVLLTHIGGWPGHYPAEGAAGRQGWHKVATLVRFTIDGTPKDLEILDFDKLKSRN